MYNSFNLKKTVIKGIYAIIVLYINHYIIIVKVSQFFLFFEEILTDSVIYLQVSFQILCKKMSF